MEESFVSVDRSIYSMISMEFLEAVFPFSRPHQSCVYSLEDRSPNGCHLQFDSLLINNPFFHLTVLVLCMYLNVQKYVESLFLEKCFPKLFIPTILIESV